MARITRTPVEDEESYEDNVEVTGDDDATHPVRSGWGSAPVKRTFTKTVVAPYVDLSDCDEHIIKIHEEKPSVAYGQHWVASQHKMYTCSQVRDEKTNRIVVDCPLCLAHHKRSEKMMMNVTEMDEINVLKIWTFGPEVGEQLQKFTKGPKDEDGKPTYIPVNDENRYWIAQRSNGARTSYTVQPLKARDLYEDHGIQPLNENNIADLTSKLFGKEVVWINSESQLQAAADRLINSDLPKDFQQ